jgi:hypothetical protein
MKLPEELVIGTWGISRSEIPPPYEVGEEFFHFSPDGTHCWESPFIKQRRKIWRFRFCMTDSGIHITPTDPGAVSNGWDLPVATEGEYLVITNPSGHRSWLKRIHPSARPAFLTLFYDPAASSNEESEQAAT